MINYIPLIRRRLSASKRSLSTNSNTTSWTSSNTDSFYASASMIDSASSEGWGLSGISKSETSRKILYWCKSISKSSR
jgi:hypothetical protein